MKVKVCGITQMNQFKALNAMGIDYVGFIFYPPSKRYAGTAKFNNAELLRLKSNANVTAVFVNPTLDEVKEALYLLPNINTLQFHGEETPEFCANFKNKFTIIKAFKMDENFDASSTNGYKNSCDYFLLDTYTNQYGGSGKKFDWKILSDINFEKPFFLSGGISKDDAENILSFQHKNFYGIDINSQFEIEPGIKDIQLIESFVKQLKNE